MRQFVKSFATGALAGIAVYFVSIYTLARTNAFVMPESFSLVVWEWLVVFGVGATLVALVIHLTALAIFNPNRLAAFAGLTAALVLALASSGLLQTGLNTLTSWLIGALLATAIAKLRSNKSFKPRPLRGSA